MNNDKEKLLELTLTMIRHDTINNLAVIQSAIKILIRSHPELKDEEMIKEIFKIIKDTADSLQKTRELTKKNYLKSYDLKKVIGEVKNNFPKQKIEINILKNYQLNVDEGIFSVFNNIISNAFHHGEASKIDITAHIHKKNIVVNIINDGKLISKKDLTHIFERGYFSQKTGNTGIGLFIVQETMQRYGGAVKVKNEKGVKFTLLFPIK